MALEDPKVIPLEGTQWHVYAAFGGFQVSYCFCSSGLKTYKSYIIQVANFQVF